MTMTPEQLREEAAAIERMHGETLTVEWRLHMAELLRAHAAALEEIERLKGERDVAVGMMNVALDQREQAERRCERLKFHAEAMAFVVAAAERKLGNESYTLAAYRRDFPKE